MQGAIQDTLGNFLECSKVGQSEEEFNSSQETITNKEIKKFCQICNWVSNI